MTGIEFAELLSKYLEEKGEGKLNFQVIGANPDQSKHLETATFKLMGVDFDVNNLRKEAYDEKTRIPTMELGTAEEDARRRDFTFNTLYWNIMENKVEDFTGKGRADLEAGVVRTPLDPLKTFSDDPLRILRAARFAGEEKKGLWLHLTSLSLGKLRYRLAPELEMAAASDTIRPLLAKKVSREHFGKELAKALHEYPSEAGATMISLLCKWGLADVIFALPTNSPLQLPNLIENARRAIVPQSLFPISCPAIPSVATRFLDCEEARAWGVRGLTLGLKYLEQARSFLAEKKFDGDTRAALLMCSFLTPLFGATYKKKSKQVLVQNFILAKSIQRPQDVSPCETINTAAIFFAQLARRVVALSSPNKKHRVHPVGQTSEVKEVEDDQDSMDSLLKEVGWAVRYAQDLTPVVLDVLLIKAKTQESFSPTEVQHGFCFPSISEVEQLIKWLNGHRLMAFHSASPLLDGRELMRLLNVKGRTIGYAKNSILEWQFTHPEGTKEQAMKWLVGAFPGDAANL